MNGTILFFPPMYVQMKSCFGNTKEIGRRWRGIFSYFFSAMLRGPRCYTVIRRNTVYEHQNIHKHSSTLELQGNFKQIEIPAEMAETSLNRIVWWWGKYIIPFRLLRLPLIICIVPGPSVSSLASTKTTPLWGRSFITFTNFVSRGRSNQSGRPP